MESPLESSKKWTRHRGGWLPDSARGSESFMIFRHVPFPPGRPSKRSSWARFFGRELLGHVPSREILTRSCHGQANQLLGNMFCPALHEAANASPSRRYSTPAILTPSASKPRLRKQVLRRCEQDSKRRQNNPHDPSVIPAEALCLSFYSSAPPAQTEDCRHCWRGAQPRITPGPHRRFFYPSRLA